MKLDHKERRKRRIMLFFAFFMVIIFLGSKMNKQELTGRVAVVTGASTGIGRWSAIALAECGAAVVINFHRNQTGAAETKRIIDEASGRALIIQADVSTKKGANALVEEAREKLGP